MKTSIVSVVVALVLGSSHHATALPTVTSGTLVAHFDATPATVAVDASGNVLSWTASNDTAIKLDVFGSSPTNIQYSPIAGFNGGPAIVVNDPAGTNQVLRGAIPGSHTAVTLFWHGFYSPGRGNSLTDSAGQ